MKLWKRVGALLMAGAMVLSTAAVAMADEAVEETVAEEVVAVEEVAAEEAVTEEAVTEEVAEEVVEETAEEIAVVEQTTYQMGDFIKDQENWTFEGESVTFDGGKLSFVPKAKTFFTYTGQKFADGVLQTKATFNFNDGKAWGGFALRCVNDTAVSWSGNHSYLVVIKKSQIELQRYNSYGNKFLTIVDNKGFIEENKPCNITLGSVEVNGGVQIFMYADDKLVFNCFDNDGEKANRHEGYAAVYAGGGVVLEAYDEQKLPTIPAGFAIEKNENVLSAAFDTVISFVDDEPEFTVTWGKNDVYQGELTELQAAGEAEFAGYNPAGIYPAVEGVDGAYTLTEADNDKYIIAYVKDKDGNIVSAADPYFFDTIETEKKKMIILLVDCEYSYVFGEKVMIDPDDAWVAPTVENDRTLVPIRFISESLGAQVGWEEATETVTITKEDITISMQLGKKEYTVNGEVKEMDVEATTMRDRTMVPLRVISETFGKNVFWDDKGLIIISDEAPIWDSEKDAETIDRIIEDIKLFL